MRHFHLNRALFPPPPPSGCVLQVELSYLAQKVSEFNRRSPHTWCVVGNCFSLQKEHETALRFFQVRRRQRQAKAEEGARGAGRDKGNKREREDCTLYLFFEVQALKQLRRGRCNARAWSVLTRCCLLLMLDSPICALSRAPPLQRAIQLNSDMTYAYTLCGHEYVANEDFDKVPIDLVLNLQVSPFSTDDTYVH